MTIKDLIAHLQTFDETKQVLVKGYEGGYHDLELDQIFEVTKCKDVYKDWDYYGPHDVATEWNEDLQEDCELIPAILLNRNKYPY